jgi:hypothetical protein
MILCYDFIFGKVEEGAKEYQKGPRIQREHGPTVQKWRHWSFLERNLGWAQKGFDIA